MTREIFCINCIFSHNVPKTKHEIKVNTINWKLFFSVNLESDPNMFLKQKFLVVVKMTILVNTCVIEVKRLENCQTATLFNSSCNWDCWRIRFQRRLLQPNLFLPIFRNSQFPDFLIQSEAGLSPWLLMTNVDGCVSDCIRLQVDNVLECHRVPRHPGHGDVRRPTATHNLTLTTLIIKLPVSLK